MLVLFVAEGDNVFDGNLMAEYINHHTKITEGQGKKQTKKTDKKTQSHLVFSF